MMDWLCRHPVVLTVAVVLGSAFLAAFPLPILLLGSMVAAFWGISTLHNNVTVTKARVRQRADYEHWLVMNGDSRGMYGTWRPL